jgi:hypothetical protein
MENHRYLRSAVLFASALFSGPLLSSQCGMPVFTGQMYTTINSWGLQNYSQQYLDWRNGELRQWCVDRHGSWLNGGCTPGPNWVCNLNAGTANAGTRQLPAPAPHISTSQTMKQEIVSSAMEQIVEPLLDSLFAKIFNSGADDAQNAQLQQQYLLQQQQLAAQRKAAEERRKQKMFDDLSGTMKMNGSPNLQLKTSGGDAGGLHLKLIGGIYDPNHAGNPSLPGIALNGGNTPYGVPGLPGIYTNGPSSAPVMQESGLQLKLGDSSTNSSSTPASPPATDSTAQAGGLQLKLGDSGSNNPSAPATQSVDASKQPSAQQSGPSLVPAPTTTTTDAANAVPPSATNAARNPVLSQAQQIQANSQAAAAASSSEAMKAQSAVGWDGGSAHGGSAVHLPSPNAALAMPKPAPVAPSAPTSNPAPPVQVANLERPVPVLNTVIAGKAPGSPIFKPQISAAVQVMSNEQLRAKYCHVQGMVKQLHEGFLKETGAFDGWQKQVGDAKRAEYEESRQCFFDNLAESMADAAGEKLVDFGDWMLNDLLKKGWEGAEEFKDNVELITTMKSTAEDVKEALDKYHNSEKTVYDRGVLSASLLNDFYSIASAMPGVEFDGTEFTGLAICMANYMVTTAEQRLLNEELSRANKSVEDQLRAERALSKFSGEMVDAQLIRGMHPADACK